MIGTFSGMRAKMQSVSKMMKMNSGECLTSHKVRAELQWTSSIDVLHKDSTMLHHPRQRVSHACSSKQYTSTLAVPSKSLHLKSLRHAHHGVLAACTTQRVKFSTSMTSPVMYCLLSLRGCARNASWVLAFYVHGQSLWVMCCLRRGCLSSCRLLRV